MHRATGIGGFFFRAKDPAALARWYREALGVDTYSDDAPGIWRQEAGPTVVTPFPAESDYFGRAEQTHMLNLRVPRRSDEAAADSAPSRPGIAQNRRPRGGTR